MFDNEHLTYICGHYKKEQIKHTIADTIPGKEAKQKYSQLLILFCFFFIPCGTFRSYRKISRNTVYKNGRLKYQQF